MVKSEGYARRSAGVVSFLVGRTELCQRPIKKLGSATELAQPRCAYAMCLDIMVGYDGQTSLSFEAFNQVLSKSPEDAIETQDRRQMALTTDGGGLQRVVMLRSDRYHTDSL